MAGSRGYLDQFAARAVWDTRDFLILLSASILITARTTCWQAACGSGAVPGLFVTPRAPVSLLLLTST